MIHIIIVIITIISVIPTGRIKSNFGATLLFFILYLPSLRAGDDVICNMVDTGVKYFICAKARKEIETGI